jgi:hypothetical protein
MPMKKIFWFLLLLIGCLRGIAEEGMWLPFLLGEQVYADMVKKGLKLTKEQLFSINKPSIKDAVVRFSGECTATIVSSDGLLFTNHHCGYDAIAMASAMDHNYLHEGFYAKSRQEEIPAKATFVDFLVKAEDITALVQDSLKGLTGAERDAKLKSVRQSIAAKYSDQQHFILAECDGLFNGNQFIIFVYQRYHDIRLVGAPPEALGDFGRETDNFQWPRFTADFSIFRVYSGRDGSAAEYNSSNVPFKSKYFLPVSLKGIKEGDFTMTYGFPGNTGRYQSSMSVQQRIEIADPALSKLLGLQRDYLLDEMKKDPSIKLQLSASYSDLSNEWKFFDGELKALVKNNVSRQFKGREDAFLKWATGKPEYENLFRDWNKLYAFWRPYSKHRLYLYTGMMGSPLLAFAGSLQELENALVKQHGGNLNAILSKVNETRKDFLKAENKVSDRKIVAAVTRLFYMDIDKNQHPIGFYESLHGSFGDLKDESTFTKYTSALFSNTMIFDDAKWNAFVSNPDATVLQEDPAFKHVSSFLKNWQNKYAVYYQQFLAQDAELGRMYQKAILEMEPAKAHYPDASFSGRISYGNVKSYNPGPSVHYDYVCTMKGLMDKYIPGDFEFDLPASFVELAKKKDFGIYGDKQRNDLIVTFISTNDIAGGNSGSPVLNAKGELIGLVFDINYESLDNTYVYDAAYHRTVCVDIRYILWCIEHYGGAPAIVRELSVVKDAAPTPGKK